MMRLLQIACKRWGARGGLWLATMLVAQVCAWGQTQPSGGGSQGSSTNVSAVDGGMTTGQSGNGSGFGGNGQA
jgi:hypothetical protein